MQTCFSSHWRIIQEANCSVVTFARGIGVLTWDWASGRSRETNLSIAWLCIPTATGWGGPGRLRLPGLERWWHLEMLLERCYLPAAPACLKCKSRLSPWPRRYSRTVWCQAPPGNPTEQSELASEREVGGRAWWVSWGALFTQQQGKKPCVPINVKRNGAFKSQHSTARVYPVLHEGLSPGAALSAAVVVTRLGSMTALSLISRIARCSFIFCRAAGLLKL